MEDYKPNSNKYKEEQRKNQEKKVEKVITGNAIAKKKSTVKKFTEGIISDDAKNVKSYVFTEVLIPAVKKLIYDIIVDSGSMILFGKTGRNDRRGTADRISYRSYYDNRPQQTRESSYAYSYDDFSLATRGEAESVISRMDELIELYGIVSVADYYDLLGKTSNNYMDNKYGWTSLKTASIIRGRDGYEIRLPRAMPLD